MMTTVATEGTQISEVTDDLEAFSAQLYGTGDTDDKGGDSDEGEQAGDRLDERADGEGEEDADPDADTEDTDDQEDKPEEVEKRKRSTAERVKAAVARQRQAEREAQAAIAARQQLEAELAVLKGGAKPGLTGDKPSDTQEAVQAPDPAKYKFGELDPQYMRDVARFEARQELQAYQRQLDEARQTEAANREIEQVRQKAAEVIQAGQAKFSDFEEVVVEAARNGEFELTKEMFETAVETSVAPDILYYLAQNPDEASTVARMSARQQAIWFGRMEAKFSQPAPEPKKKVTAAPPPPAALPKGGNTRGGVSIYDTEDPRALDLMTKALFGKA